MEAQQLRSNLHSLQAQQSLANELEHTVLEHVTANIPEYVSAHDLRSHAAPIQDFHVNQALEKAVSQKLSRPIDLSATRPISPLKSLDLLPSYEMAVEDSVRDTQQRGRMEERSALKTWLLRPGLLAFDDQIIARDFLGIHPGVSRPLLASSVAVAAQTGVGIAGFYTGLLLQSLMSRENEQLCSRGPSFFAHNLIGLAGGLIGIFARKQFNRDVKSIADASHVSYIASGAITLLTTYITTIVLGGESQPNSGTANCALPLILSNPLAELVLLSQIAMVSLGVVYGAKSSLAIIPHAKQFFSATENEAEANTLQVTDVPFVKNDSNSLV